MVSVASCPASTVPEHSTFVVADAATVDGVREQYEGIFGADIDVRAAEVLIDGVDIELILGRDFLATMLDPAAADVQALQTMTAPRRANPIG